MDFGILLKKDNPKQRANWLSKLTYAWMAKLFYKGSKRGLQIDDLYKNHKCDDSQRVTTALEKRWSAELAYAKAKNTQPSLTRAIIKTFFWSYMMSGVALLVLYVGLKTFQPLVLSYIISQFSLDDGEQRTVEKYAAGSVLVGTLIVVAFITHHSNYGVTSEGMRVRTAVSSLIYRKLLNLSQKSLGQTAAGQIVNLLSNDVSRFDLVSIALHFLWIAPIQVVVVSYFLYTEVGVSSASGIGAMIICTLPLQAVMAKVASHLRLQIAEKTDFRVRLMNEIVSGIQVIKMYSWEKPFQIMVKAARLGELKYLTQASYVRGFYQSSMVFLERTTLYLTIITYVLLGSEIKADQVFSMAQFFNLLQLGMAIFFPMAISIGAEMLISIQRLQEFLLLEEKHEAIIDRSSNKAVELSQVEAEWVPDAPTLQRISMSVQPGSLCAIVGPVGAGKSSILQLLLGELPSKSGRVQVGGSISYASQEPWLFSATVRNNILFGLEYDRNRYKKTVKVCALEPDFEQLPQGDKTVVGERGVSLSGGQRARINLARAVYREADIYLMDDPLSAVDTHVGKQLFEECISKHLSHKTRILVTHQLQYLKNADHIVVVNEGKVEAQGTFSELSNSELDFTKMLIAADETEEKEKHVQRRGSVLSSASFGSVESENKEVEKNEEEYEHTNTSTFAVYMRSGGNLCVLLILLGILLLGQAACTACDIWVTIWTEAEHIRQKGNISTETPPDVIEKHEIYTNDSRVSNPLLYTYTVVQQRQTVVYNNTLYNILERDHYIYIYTVFIVVAVVVTVFRSMLFFKVAMVASKNIHGKMFSSLLQAPMRFFDTNPSGRILNRFSKDMGTIDEVLPRILLEAIQIMLVMTGILVSVTYANLYMLIVIAVLGAVFIKLRSVYLATAKDVKHLEGIAKSPVYSHVNSSINGLTTIRASQAEGVLIRQFDSHQDVHTSAWTLTLECMCSFGLWLDLLAMVFIACITYSFILIDANGSLVGLALSQSMILSGMLQYGMRQTAEVVNQLTSVERVMQYTKLDKEGEYDTPEDKLPPITWPNQGKIVFEHLYLFYGPNDAPVLKNLNFEVQPGEKIGIVGRTGAGKSSLISALFRLAPIQGRILIDDIDTTTLGLTDLRKRISIIPQEPVLFSATLRYNLDPFNEYDDKKIWSALEEVELKESISTLDFMVTEGGSNFSVGQRQLLCLARAIVRDNKILIMDEATANVDPQTDALIQKTIRRKFATSTVLTIAHRLNTIMDSDKAIVMEAGIMIQHDEPYELLQNQNGHFYKMVQQTGPTMAKQLYEVAEEAHEIRNAEYLTKL